MDADPAESPTYEGGGEHENLLGAANELLERRDQEIREREGRPVDIERQYKQMAGTDVGKPIPGNQTISAEQAAHDLDSARSGDDAINRAIEDAAVAEAIDRLRADTQQAQPQQLQPEAPPVQQPEATQPGADDEVQRALSNPKVMAAISEHVGQYDAAYNQVSQAYAQATAANANSAYANLLASFPEIQNVRPDQLGTALQVLAQSDPQKAQAITRHIDNVSRFAQAAQQAQAAVVQQQQAQFQQAAIQHDNAFDAWSLTQDPPERVKQISGHAIQMLKNAGATDQELAYHWNNNGALRSAWAQSVLYKAAKYELLVAEMSNQQFKPVPQVQRPGVAAERTPEVDINIRNLSGKLDRTGSAKAAAELLIARRAGRR